MAFTNLNGARIYYEEHGEGFPVVLAHSAGADHGMWLGQVEDFSPRYRLVLWDFRGHGQSEVTEDGYGVAQFVEDQLALMRHLGINRAHVGGLSLGGWVAWTFALKHPEATAGLILSDAAGLGEGISDGEKELRGRLYFQLLPEVAEKHGFETLTEILIRMGYSPGFLVNNPEIVAMIRQSMQGRSGVGYNRAMKGCIKSLFEQGDPSIISSIQAPTLVLAGEDDVMTPVPTQKALADAIPGARLEIIPGAGHMSPMENPQLWNRLALEFLDGIEV